MDAFDDDSRRRAIATNAAAAFPDRGAILIDDDPLSVAAFACARAMGKAIERYPASETVAIGSAMRAGEIVAVLASARRLATNGDAESARGTYGSAVLAAYHGIPHYVVAPRAVIDFTLRHLGADARSRDGCLDVLPGRLLCAIATEYGLARPPYQDSLPSLATRPNVMPGGAAPFRGPTLLPDGG